MKKITKLSKIFLVFVTIFSQLSSVVTVLADEITSKPLTLTLERIIDEEEKANLKELQENKTVTFKTSEIFFICAEHLPSACKFHPLQKLQRVP